MITILTGKERQDHFYCNILSYGSQFSVVVLETERDQVKQLLSKCFMK